jgi:penicillin-binding protein 1C
MQELRRPDQESNWQRFGSSRPIAWKTGTSYGHKDAWAVGVTTKYVVAVWLGNADGEGRPDIIGVTAASPLMFKIFGLLKGDANFSAPIGHMTLANICHQSGQKANEYCTDISKTYVGKAIVLTSKCTYHQLLHLDQSKTYQVNSSCYPVSAMQQVPWFIIPPAQAWYYKKGNLDYIDVPDFIAGCDNNEPMMEMIYPQQFTKVFVPVELDKARGRVVFEAAHQNPDAKIYWHIDDEFVGITQNDHHLGFYPAQGTHRLSLIDDKGRELFIPFEVLNEASKD